MIRSIMNWDTKLCVAMAVKNQGWRKHGNTIKNGSKWTGCSEREKLISY